MAPSIRSGALIALAAATVVAARAGAQSLNYGFTGQTSAADQPARVGGAWSLLARASPALETGLEVSVASGDAAGGVIWPGAAVAQDRFGQDVGLGLRTRWTPTDAASLELRVDDRSRTLPLLGGSAGGGDAAQNDRSEQSAQLSAALKPARGLDLKLTGRLDVADDAVTDTDGGARMELKTRGGEVRSVLRWTPQPRLAFEAGATLDTADVTWRQQASTAQSYAALQPRLAAVLTPAKTTEWRVELARAVSPLDPGRFVALARAVDAGAGAGPGAGFGAGAHLDPDAEWRVQSVMTQTLPADGKLRLTLTEAAIERATELTRVGAGVGVEAPGNTPGGARQEVNLFVALPLASLGLPTLSLETSGGWRRSQVQDPLTGQMRRPSGEAPYDGRVALAQAVPNSAVKWGVDAHATGPQSYYGLTQTSAGEADGVLGAFVEYRPRDLLLRLSVDNLTGDVRRWQDTFYDGDRDVGAVSRIVRREDGAPSFSFSLHRAL